MYRKVRSEVLCEETIARKLVNKTKRGRLDKIINHLSGFGEEDEATASLHPAHAVYVRTLNQISIVTERLTAHRELAPLTRILEAADELYMPSVPPISPVTKSYFNCWAFFDACTGTANETIGTIILELSSASGIDSDLVRSIRLMQETRMGLYVHKGREGNLVVLEELVTGAVCRAMVASGYPGTRGELWYVRLMPPFLPDSPGHVVLTTPYVIVKPEAREWHAYFNRTLPNPAPAGHYERHMKYGPTRAYWNDFIFEAYVNHRHDAIYLTGLPDIPESRPHSATNTWGFGSDNTRPH